MVQSGSGQPRTQHLANIDKEQWPRYMREREREKAKKSYDYSKVMYKLCEINIQYIKKQCENKNIFTLCGLLDLQMNHMIWCPVAPCHRVDGNAPILTRIWQTSIVNQQTSISKSLKPPWKKKPKMQMKLILVNSSCLQLCHKDCSQSIEVFFLYITWCLFPITCLWSNERPPSSFSTRMMWHAFSIYNN